MHGLQELRARGIQDGAIADLVASFNEVFPDERIDWSPSDEESGEQASAS